MKKICLRTLVTICLLMATVFVFLSSGQTTVYAEQSQPDFYEVDGVYSTYSPSTNYTINGGMYTSRGGLAVRASNTERNEAGLTLPLDADVTVSANSAIVLNIMMHTNLTRTMRLDIVQADSTVTGMQNTLPAYKAKDGSVVSTLEIGNNAFNNNLGPSTGYHANDGSVAYNQLVVPLTSYGFSIGETVSLSEVNLYVPAWSTGQYNKYVLSSVLLTETFSTDTVFDGDVFWDAATDPYEEYGNLSGNFDVRYLEPGQIWMDPSVNSSGTGIFQELVFKFPDALINESGMVETANLKGLTLEFLNGTDTAFNGHFKLYNDQLEWIANSNYSNLKTEKVTKDGVVASSNAKYFYPNTNTVGYADSFILYNFNATSSVTSESTESFYSAAGDLPAEISPYFTYTYDNNQTMSLEPVFLGTIRILTEDTTLYEHTATSDEDVSISAVKSYLGNDVTFMAEDNGRTVEDVTLNDASLSEADVTALFSESGLTVTVTGSMALVIEFEVENAFTVTFYDEDGETVLDTQTVGINESAIPPEDPTKPATPEFTYTFDGWNGDYENVTGNVDVFATYAATVNQYTVTFYDEDGETVLGTSTVDYGEPAIAPEDPTKPATAEFTYTFDGWNGDFSEVTEDLDVIATYASTVNQYTVTFVDDDGETVLGTSTVDYGQPAIAPEDPSKDGSTYYQLTFEGWNGSFDEVMENMTIEAVYTASLLDEGNLIEAGNDTIESDDAWVDAGIVLSGEGIDYDMTGEVDPSTTGTYQLTYEVSYRDQALATYHRFVHVVEPKIDVTITLEPDVTTIFLNSDYEDAGASTNVGSIEVFNEVNTAEAGVYVIEYLVTIDGESHVKSKYVTVLDSEGIVPVLFKVEALVYERKELINI